MFEEKKAMIIVWKWSSQKQPSYDSETRKYVLQYYENISAFFKDGTRFDLSVGNETNSIIVGFSKYNTIYTLSKDGKNYKGNKSEYSNENIEGEVNSKLAEGYNVILFLHKGSPDLFSMNHPIIKSLKVKDNLKIKLFGGSGTIYDELLNAGSFNFRSDALINGDKPNALVKESAFNSVWDFYWNECKTKLFELKEDLLFALYPYFWEKDNISDLKLSELLESRIKNFISNYPETNAEKEKFKKLEEENNNYYNFNDCKTTYNQKCKDDYKFLKCILKCFLNKNNDDLLEVIKSEKISINNLSTIFRNKFDSMLTSISGQIY